MVMALALAAVNSQTGNLTGLTTVQFNSWMPCLWRWRRLHGRDEAGHRGRLLAPLRGGRLLHLGDLGLGGLQVAAQHLKEVKIVHKFISGISYFLAFAFVFDLNL